MRYLEKEFVAGECQYLLNMGQKPGDETTLHFHDYPHNVIALTPIEIFAIVNGERVVVDADWGDVYTIQAGVEHKVVFKTEKGRFYCQFCRWGADGYRPAPKQWTGNPKPVTT
jgi:hypothetical protein